MISLNLLIVFIVGVAVGSFLNVVIYRWGSEEKIVNSRSKCLSCGHQLGWRDLFPVLSFIILRGKCRYCEEKISWQYPIVEITTGMLFIFAFEKVFFTPQVYFFGPALAQTNPGLFDVLNIIHFAALIIFLSALIVIFVYDIRHYIIPDKIIYPLIASVLVFWIAVLFAGGRALAPYAFSAVFAAFAAGGFFLFLIIATKGRGMGGGDVKLGFLMGLVLGIYNTLLALFIAFVSGAIVGIFLVLLKRKKMKSMIPFGPFLILGFFVAYFYGSEIMNWYLKTVLG